MDSASFRHGETPWGVISGISANSREQIREARLERVQDWSDDQHGEHQCLRWLVKAQAHVLESSYPAALGATKLTEAARRAA